MKKIIILLCTLVCTSLLSGCSIDEYNIKFSNNLVLNQYNTFNPYDIEAYDKNKKDLSDNVVIHGLELLNIKNNRITEFGSFSIRYTIVIENEVVFQKYRNIKVNYLNNNTNGLIYNSDFKAGLIDWGIVDWQNSLEVSVDDKLNIIQKSVDNDIWDQSIYQYVNTLELNKKYKISFKASSTTNKTIKVCLAQTFAFDPWSYNLMNETDINITNEEQRYEIEFTCTSPTNIKEGIIFDITKARLEFKFGKYNNLNNNISTITFDDINIFEIK